MLRKRIAIVRPYAEPVQRGYYNSQELGLAKALSKIECDIDVFVVGHTANTEVLRSGCGSLGRIQLHEMPFHCVPNVKQAIFPRVRTHLKQGNYDLIQTNESNELESWLVSRMARHLNIPLVLYQGMYQPITGRVQKAFQLFFDRVCLPQLVRNTTLAFAKTKRAASFMRSRGFDKVQVLPIGLDTDAFTVNSGQVDWRQKLNLAADSPIVLYVGVLEPRRNTKLIVELAEHFRDTGVHFVIAGTGPEQAMVENAVAGGVDNLKYVGRVPQADIPSLYRQSTCLILPSNYEIYGMVVLEAMYVGLPVIASRTAGPEDIIEHNYDGMLVESMDKQAWVVALNRLLQDDQLRREMLERCRTKIADHLTWDKVAQQYYSRAFGSDESSRLK